MHTPDKILYHWNSVDNSYLTESIAEMDPRNKSRYIIPARSTDVKPPKTQKEQTAIFDTETQEWNIVPDYRNTAIFSIETGESMLWATVGELPKGWTNNPKPDDSYAWNSTKKKWVIDKEAKKAKKIKTFLGEYTTKKEAGVEFNGSTFNTSSDLFALINNALIVYDEMPSNFIIPDVNNSAVKMTRSELIQLSKIIQEHFRVLLENYSTKKRNTERA